MMFLLIVVEVASPGRYLQIAPRCHSRRRAGQVSILSYKLGLKELRLVPLTVRSANPHGCCYDRYYDRYTKYPKIVPNYYYVFTDTASR